MEAGAAPTEARDRHGDGGARLLMPAQGLEDSEPDCPLCAELAAAGHYLPPDAIVLPAPLFAAFAPFVPLAVLTALRQRSHRWQSRAPPR